MRAGFQPRELRQEPDVDHRRRMDARDDGLRQVSERTGRRRALRWVVRGVVATRRLLQGKDRVRRVIWRELQDVPEADVGGASRVV